MGNSSGTSSRCSGEHFADVQIPASKKGTDSSRDCGPLPTLLSSNRQMQRQRELAKTSACREVMMLDNAVGGPVHGYRNEMVKGRILKSVDPHVTYVDFKPIVGDDSLTAHSLENARWEWSGWGWRESKKSTSVKRDKNEKHISGFTADIPAPWVSRAF